MGVGVRTCAPLVECVAMGAEHCPVCVAEPQSTQGVEPHPVCGCVCVCVCVCVCLVSACDE